MTDEAEPTNEDILLTLTMVKKTLKSVDAPAAEKALEMGLVERKMVKRGSYRGFLFLEFTKKGRAFLAASQL